MGRVVSVVGCGFGDEGKGKIIDAIAKDFDIVCRYQGGDNAGHTVSFEDKVFKLSLIPTGIFNSRTRIVLAHGMVINPKRLITEINYLEKAGFPLKDRLVISKDAHLVLDHHIRYDRSIESLDERTIGTTLRGIGYAYSDKASRINLRVGDIFEREQVLREKFSKIAKIYDPFFKAYNQDVIDVEGEIKKLTSLRKRLREYVKDTITLLRDEVKKGSKILLEGSQGILLDIDYGNYPYVTSSSITNPLSTTGFNYQDIKKIIGVVKAYTTRVGNGLLITEIKNKKTSSYIRERGREYGTVTERSRRIG